MSVRRIWVDDVDLDPVFVAPFLGPSIKYATERVRSVDNAERMEGGVTPEVTSAVDGECNDAIGQLFAEVVRVKSISMRDLMPGRV